MCNLVREPSQVSAASQDCAVAHTAHIAHARFFTQGDNRTYALPRPRESRPEGATTTTNGNQRNHFSLAPDEVLQHTANARVRLYLVLRARTGKQASRQNKQERGQKGACQMFESGAQELTPLLPTNTGNERTEGLPQPCSLCTRNKSKQTGKHARPAKTKACLLYTSPSPRDRTRSRMPSSA